VLMVTARGDNMAATSSIWVVFEMVEGFPYFYGAHTSQKMAKKQKKLLIKTGICTKYNVHNVFIEEVVLSNYDKEDEKCKTS